MLVLHWVAGEQGHTLNEFSNPSNTGSYCDFTKERGKVRATISYLKYSKFRGDSCEGEFAWVAITKLRKYQPEETFSDIDTFWENLWQRWTCAGKILPICTFGWTETLKVDCSLGKTLEPLQRHHFLWPLEKRRIKYYLVAIWLIQQISKKCIWSLSNNIIALVLLYSCSTHHCPNSKETSDQSG